MELLLKSIEHAIGQECLLPAIVTTLTIPDIAGAVDQPGIGSQTRYITWIDQHLAPVCPNYKGHGLDGATMYGLRCKLLHEGLTSPMDAPAAQKSAAASRKRLVAFNLGRGPILHLCTSTDQAGDTWTILRAEMFCADVVKAARTWLSSKASDTEALDRLDRLISIRMDVPGLVLGIPILCAAV